MDGTLQQLLATIYAQDQQILALQKQVTEQQNRLDTLSKPSAPDETPPAP